MKKFLILILLVGLAAIPVYKSITASEFAVSQASPLGEYHAIDSWLMERGFEKTEGVLDSDDPELADAFQWVYNDVEKSREDNVAYRVTLILDSQDKVRAVGAVFYSGSHKLDMPLSRTESLHLPRESGGTREVPAHRSSSRCAATARSPSNSWWRPSTRTASTAWRIRACSTTSSCTPTDPSNGCRSPGLAPSRKEFGARPLLRP